MSGVIFARMSSRIVPPSSLPHWITDGIMKEGIEGARRYRSLDASLCNLTQQKHSPLQEYLANPQLESMNEDRNIQPYIFSARRLNLMV